VPQVERLARDQRQGEAGAEDLPTAFAPGAVDLDHVRGHARKENTPAAEVHAKSAATGPHVSRPARRVPPAPGRAPGTWRPGRRSPRSPVPRPPRGPAGLQAPAG